jgi:hypothetical protein
MLPNTNVYLPKMEFKIIIMRNLYSTLLFQTCSKNISESKFL